MYAKLQQTLSIDGRSLNSALATLDVMSKLPVTIEHLEANVDVIKALKKVKKMVEMEGDDGEVVAKIKASADSVYTTWKQMFSANS